jgi:elongation factor Ts
VDISAEAVRELRDKTGAGVMDCKKALAEKKGNVEDAIRLLREQGMADARKRVGRATAEGRVASYIHMGGKVGVILEVNSETDFVARTDKFGELAHNLCMQVAAMNPVAVRREDVPAAVVEEQTAIFRKQAEGMGKPEKAIPKIIEGKLSKYFEDSCLLEQAFVKDPEKTVGDLVRQAAGEFGENIQVRRFVRFQVGGEDD